MAVYTIFFTLSEGDTISVSLPPHTAVTSLKALFTTAGKSVYVGENLQESGVSTNDFTGPVIYTVHAEDGTIQTYTVTVTVQKATTKEITCFGFKPGSNPALATDVNGDINIADRFITVIMPYGSSITELKATFETNGSSVTVDGIEQVTDITVNNFSSDLVYSVTAQDGSQNDYTVRVTVARNNAKAITRYILDGETCAIDESSHLISVSFPSGKMATGLIASFISTGTGITVGGAEQVSGVTANDFSSPVIYTVTAEDGSLNNYTISTIMTPEIIGLWNFEYGSDGSFTVAGATETDGILGKALFFDIGNYVRIPDSDALTLATEGSIEVIIEAYSHRPYAGIVHKGVQKDFSDESYSLQFWGTNGTDGTVRFSIFNDAGDYAYVDSSTKLALMTWYHIAATWDTSTISLYINGRLEKSIANTIGKVRNTDGDLIIGAQLPENYSTSWSNLVFNGIIDRVQIKSKAFSSSEVSALYQALPFASGGLTGYIIHVAVKNYHVIFAAILIITVLLTIIFVYNRRHLNT